MNLDHTQVSELLAAYVRDELSAEQAADVRAHLDDCETCRAEWSGVLTLASLPDERLEPFERVALRDAVRARVVKRSWSRRLAPALGALGLVAVVVVGAASILGDGVVGGDDAATTARGEAELGEEGAAKEQRAAAPAAVPRRGGAAGDMTKDAAGTTEGAGSLSENAQTESLFGLALSFADAGPLTRDLLTVRDTDRFAYAPRKRLGPLLGAAPDDRWADQMRTCTDVVTSFLPRSARAAYAAVYPADGLLVMGFLWSENGTQRYAFWGWPAGDCSTVTPIYASGTI